MLDHRLRDRAKYLDGVEARRGIGPNPLCRCCRRIVHAILLGLRKGSRVQEAEAPVMDLRADGVVDILFCRSDQRKIRPY